MIDFLQIFFLHKFARMLTWKLHDPSVTSGIGGEAEGQWSHDSPAFRLANVLQQKIEILK